MAVAFSTVANIAGNMLINNLNLKLDISNTQKKAVLINASS